MEKKRKMLAIVALAMMAILTASMFYSRQMEKDTLSPVMAEQVVRAVSQGDEEGAYALMFPDTLGPEGFHVGFEEMCRIWTEQGGGETFTMELTGWQSGAGQGGMKRYSSTYRVTSGEAEFTFQLIRGEQGEQSGMLTANFEVKNEK